MTSHNSNVIFIYVYLNLILVLYIYILIVKCVHGEVYSIQYYVIKFVSDLRQVGGFLLALVSSTNKTDCHDITEILLKVALNIIALTSNPINSLMFEFHQ
jgi:hypothetical protein